MHGERCHIRNSWRHFRRTSEKLIKNHTVSSKAFHVDNSEIGFIMLSSSRSNICWKVRTEECDRSFKSHRILSHYKRKHCQCLRNSEPVERENTKAFSQNCVDFAFSTYSATSQERNQTRQTSRAREVSSIGTLQTFLLFLQCSPLPVLGFDGETRLSGSHIKDTSTQCFNQSAGSHCLRSAI